MAAVHRSAGPGQQVDQEYGEGAEAEYNQVEWHELLEDAGECDSVRHARAARECGWGAGSHSAADSAQVHVQAARYFEFMKRKKIYGTQEWQFSMLFFCRIE